MINILISIDNSPELLYWEVFSFSFQFV